MTNKLYTYLQYCVYGLKFLTTTKGIILMDCDDKFFVSRSPQDQNSIFPDDVESEFVWIKLHNFFNTILNTEWTSD